MEKKKSFFGSIAEFFKNNWWKILREIFLWTNVVFMVFPLLFMFLSATKTSEEYLSTPFSFPVDFPGTLVANFMSVITGKISITRFGEIIELDIFTPFMNMFFNSLILTVFSLLGMLIVALMFGYALGTKQFKGKGLMIFFLLIIQSVPFFGYIVPLHFVTNGLRMVGKLLGVVPVYIAVSLPMAIILFQGYFSTFPKEIEEAGMIDGCNEFQKFMQIVVPISQGAIASLAIINFMGYWNEYAIAELMLGATDTLITINMGVMLSDEGSYFSYAFMLLALSAIPNFIFFTVFQKQIVGGLTLGAVKG